MKISLGRVYRDMITGFVGVAVSRHEYLNGCVRITIQPKELYEGKPLESQTFDVEQIEVVADQSPIVPRRRDTGGPGDVPAARKEPRR